MPSTSEAEIDQARPDVDRIGVVGRDQWGQEGAREEEGDQDQADEPERIGEQPAQAGEAWRFRQRLGQLGARVGGARLAPGARLGPRRGAPRGAPMRMLRGRRGHAGRAMR